MGKNGGLDSKEDVFGGVGGGGFRNRCPNDSQATCFFYLFVVMVLSVFLLLDMVAKKRYINCLNKP